MKNFCKKFLFFSIFCLISSLLFAGGAYGTKATDSVIEKGKPVLTSTDDYEVYATNNKKAPVVYFTRDISAQGLVKIYNALKWKPTGKIGVKISTGEPPASNYLQPELIKDLVQKLDATIVECNTAYAGKRGSNAFHKQVAKDHGFLEIAPFDLLDEDGSSELNVEGGEVLKVNYVGSHFSNYDSYLVLSHFKGHQMAGFGGAIKNLSIGFGSGTSVKKSGKAWIHSGGRSYNSNFWVFTSGDKSQKLFLKAMAESAKSVCDAMGNEKGIVFINVMNRLSIDCDCNGYASDPDMHDIGIAASLDPLAIDQACIDLIFTSKDKNDSFVKRVESRMGRLTLEHAEKIKLGKGSRNYRLVYID